MARRFTLVLAALVFALVAASCGATVTEAVGSADSAGHAAASGSDALEQADQVGSATGDATTYAEIAEPTVAPALEPTATPEPTPEPTAVPEPIIAGVMLIDARTELRAEGNPTLSWDAVDAAADYRVIVLDEAGAPYWAWAGDSNEATPPAGGPTIGSGYQWTVTAFDLDGSLLAASAQQIVGG